MPELPEVEIWCRMLAQCCNGHRIRAIEIQDPRVVRGDLDLSGMVDQSVQWVRRRAKLGLIGLERHVLMFHLRMTGQWLTDGSSTPRKRVRATIGLDSGTNLYFDDRRCLGHLRLVSLSELDSWMEGMGLGPEPWPEHRSGHWWKERLIGLRGPIKPALMRQERVAGLGNIAASESCFWAGLDPRRSVPSLTNDEWDALATGVHRYIETTLEAESGRELVYVTQGGTNPFQIYGRRSGCPQCGGIVEQVRQSGRMTWFCQQCQQ